MPKMRRRNVGADDIVADYYLTCGKRHNQPRIHIRICEESCRNVKKCVFYKSWCVTSRTKEIYKDKEKSKEEEKFSNKTKKKYYKSKIKKTKRIKKIKSKEI